METNVFLVAEFCDLLTLSKLSQISKKLNIGLKGKLLESRCKCLGENVPEIKQQERYLCDYDFCINNMENQPRFVIRFNHDCSPFPDTISLSFEDYKSLFF